MFCALNLKGNKMNLQVTASCDECGATVQADDNTPNDQMVKCSSCGADLGSYGDIVAAMQRKGVSAVEDAVADMISDFNRKN